MLKIKTKDEIMKLYMEVMNSLIKLEKPFNDVYLIGKKYILEEIMGKENIITHVQDLKINGEDVMYRRAGKLESEAKGDRDIIVDNSKGETNAK